MRVTKEQRNTDKWGSLYLIRHGESTFNEVNRFAGSVDAPLTSLGEAQACRAAASWSGPVPDRIYVSPLQRARRTAGLLLPALSQDAPRSPEFILDVRIQERDFGDFTLRNKAFLQREVGLTAYEAALYGECGAPGGESFEMFRERILSFLRDELHPLLVNGQCIVVVSHKYVIELLSRLILRLPAEDGYDVRLPNATLLNAAQLTKYICQESRFANNAREWILLNHSLLILASALLGLLIGSIAPGFEPPPLLALLLLALATGITLARVDFSRPRRTVGRTLASPYLLLVRYLILPLSVGLVAVHHGQELESLFLLSIIFAAPAAVSGVTLSRCWGGIVLPSALTIIVSTCIAALVIPLLLGLSGGDDLLRPTLLLLITSSAALMVPLGLVYVLRAWYPIATAKFAERHSAVAVILLALFVALTCAGVGREAFEVHATYAFGLGAALRVTALALLRHNTVYAVDDYISMSYPNIFLVVVLASWMQMESLSALATWFLLPMFALAPVDEWLCRKVLAPGGEAELLPFLGVPQNKS